MVDIVHATFNARYEHCSFGLRCLLANLGELAPRGLLEVYLMEMLKHPAAIAAGTAGRDELKARRESKSAARRQARHER